jgi:hypothetical protein
MPEPRELNLRRPDTCSACGTALAAGTRAIWDPAARSVSCVQCPTGEPTPHAAGTSARAEYERRRTRRETDIRTRHPYLGGVILAVTDEPQSTRSWDRGADGEVEAARRLEKRCAGSGVVFLHDRGILCFVDGDLPLFSIDLDGISVRGPRKTADICTRAGALTEGEVADVARALADALPPAR